MPNYHKSESALFENGYKKSETHPDLQGTIELTDEQLSTILKQRKSGEKPTLKMAGWKRNAKNTGASYLYLSIEAVEKEDDGFSPPQNQGQTHQPTPVQSPPPQDTGSYPWES